MDTLYTCAQVAERYGVKAITVWDWIRRKRLPAIKIGKEYRIRERDIVEFESKNQTIGE